MEFFLPLYVLGAVRLLNIVINSCRLVASWLGIALLFVAEIDGVFASASLCNVSLA